jgi:hypothetical protein
MKQFLAALCLMGALRLPAPAQSSLGMIQPDAGVVFGVEWRRIVDSPVGGMLTEQLKKAEFQQVPGFQVLQETLLRDLDSVLIAAPASGLSKGSAQPPMLAVVKGRFDVAQLRGLILGKSRSVENYRSVELLIPAENTAAKSSKTAANNRVAFLDANTMLAGDRAEIRAAIDRVKTGSLTAPNRGVLASVSELAAKNDIWMTVEIPPNALKDVPPAAAQMFSGVKTAEIGMSFAQGFGLQVNVRAKDDPSAHSMAQAIQGLIAMAALGQSETPQAAEILRKIQITTENSRVKLALALDRSEVEKMIQESQTRAKASPEPKTAPARALEPPGPKTVRITGLDSGPVEVPLSETKK